MPGEERDWVEIDGGRVEVILLPPLRRDDPTPWLLFAHGNGEVVDLWAGAFETVRASGIGVALVEYPGYGQSSGSPSERSIQATMVAAYDLVGAREDADAEKLIGYGRSLGGGAVCALARRRSLAGLILESTFTSVPVLARRMGVPGFLVLDRFDNESVVADFEGPVLVVHGERDTIIPIEHGRRLAEVASRAELVVLACGHNDCPRPWDAVVGFVARLESSTWLDPSE